jgi:hypothetical protein
MWTQLNVSTGEEAKTAEEPVVLRKPYDPLRARQGSDHWTKLVLSAATIIALWYVTTSVMKYLHVTRETYGLFWPRHEWLFAHVIAGTIAVVFGPVQFWLGLKRDQPTLHRTIGVAYVVCTAVGAISAIYLALHTVYGWIFGAGLTAMAVAWILTTGMATIAIYRKKVPPSPAMDDPQLSHYVWVRSVPLHDRHPRDGQRRDDGRTDGFLKLGMLDASPAHRRGRHSGPEALG